MKTLIGLAVAIVASGCGGSSNPSNGGNCSITLSGAVTGSFTCTTAAIGVYDSSSNHSAAGFSYNGAQTNANPNISVAIDFGGTVRNGTFVSTEAGASGGAVITGASNAAWVATAGSGSAGEGSYTMVISSSSAIAGSANGTAFTVHGTYDATLAASSGSGATGTVTLHATF